MLTTRKRARYVAGVDGGGTKTACMIADEAGAILSYALAEGSNHQICGLARALENVCRAVDTACSQAGLRREELSFIYLGMAGADTPEDCGALNRGLAQCFCSVPFQMVNDIWIAFACETDQTWGAVSVCGTGGNLGVCDPQGKIYTVRALRYALGNYGGGYHLAEIALHWAFRAEEHTGPATRLTEMLPRYCGCESMDELAKKIYKSDYRYYRNFNIPKLVFDLAWEGDSVCRDILTGMGRYLGDMLGRLICHARLQEKQVPVVLAGSQYAKDEHRLLIGPLEERLCGYVPGAQLHVVHCPPVAGAVFRGLEALGCRPQEGRCQAMKQDLKNRFP
ncbi:MAG TPA: hypothetical protein H9883_08140 [Candidatus Ruthenibacterium merdigallinarum]|nr:hypothetical protein [Candidatus Ruthenibacterium merdigallinarum]